MNIMRLSISEAYHSRSVTSADALDEAKKVMMLVLETVVEFLCYLLDIESSEHVSGDVDDLERSASSSSVKTILSNFWMRGSPLWSGTVDMGARAVRPARFTFDPEPVLDAVVVDGEDDDMLTHLPGDPSLDLAGGWDGREALRRAGLDTGRRRMPRFWAMACKG